MTGILASRPGTWNARSTILDASTLPGKERTIGRSPAATTVVLTGRASSAEVECWDEHPAARQTIDRTTGNPNRASPLDMQASVQFLQNARPGKQSDGDRRYQRLRGITLDDSLNPK